MTLGAAAIVLGACLLLEAFFSGAELALISADKVQLRHLAEARKDRRGRLILEFLDDPGQLISACLVGTNICVVLSTVVATLTLLPMFPDQAVLISLGIMTPLVLVFGEIVPKSVFQFHADLLAPRLIVLVSAFRLVVYPMVALGSWVSRVLVRSLGLDTRASAPMTREELRLMISLPSRQGDDRITADERQMVTRVFGFSKITVEDIMLPLSEVTAVSEQATLLEVAREIVDKRHTRLPVFRDRVDQIVGIVHAFDVLRAEPGTELTALFRDAIFVPESQPAVNTLVTLQRAGQGMAVVVDEYGGAVGVSTLEDIVEEIVGDIEDEYDEEPQLVRAEDDGTFTVEGRAPVDRVNEITRLGLPEGDDYETVAGLMLDRMKRLPRAGERLEVEGVTIIVTAVGARAIDEVRIKPARRRVTK